MEQKYAVSAGETCLAKNEYSRKLVLHAIIYY